jgi:hypothetical protein
VEVAGRVIDSDEVEERLRLVSALADQRLGAPQRRGSFVTSLTEIEVMAGEATRRGWVRGPEESALLSIAEAEARLRTLVDDAQGALLPEAEVAAAYQADRARYVSPELREARVLVATDPARIDEAMAAYRAARTGTSKDPLEIFEEVARTYGSVPELVATGGATGLFASREAGATTNPDISREVFKLKRSGELTPRIRTARGIEVYALVRTVPAVDFDADEADRIVRQRLARQRGAASARAWLDDTAQTVAIRIDEAAVRELSGARRQLGLEPEAALRPRRYSAEGLEKGVAAMLGNQRPAIDAAAAAAYQNPVVSVDPEGSGQPGEGSGQKPAGSGHAQGQ